MVRTMDEREMEHRLTDVEQRCRANGRRITELSGHVEAVNRLATAVEVMAARQQSMGESVERLERKVDTLEEKPGKRWEGLVDKALFALAGAFVGWLAAGLPGI